MPLLVNKLTPVVRLLPRFYSTTAKTATKDTCTHGLLPPLNNNPIGYLTLPGLVKYDTALKLQSALVARRHRITQGTLQTDLPADIICLLQHPPTFTAGRRIRGKTELNEEVRLRNLGADYHETMRGGQVTFHGPGQLIAYPILDIRDYQLNVRCYVTRLEKTIIDCCSSYNIQANTTENTGVWVGQDDKIAALGVHLQRYVSSHGLALNCNVNLDWFHHIVPCGLEEKSVTSISQQIGKQIQVDEVIPRLIKSFEKFFFKPLVSVSLDELEKEDNLLLLESQRKERERESSFKQIQ